VDREVLDFLFFWMISVRCWKHAVGEACAHSWETAENDLIFSEFEHKLCALKSLRVRISGCALMCKQEMIMMNYKYSFEHFQRKIRVVIVEAKR